MGTFVAILLGTLIGGMFASTETLLYWLCGLIVVVALLGYLAARWVPAAPPRLDTSAKLQWNVWRMAVNAVDEVRQVPGILLAIMAVSWFWFLGTVILTQLPSFSKTQLGGDASVVSLLLAMFSIGIGLGSMWCERLSGGRVEIALVSLGALGMALFGCIFANAGGAVTGDLINAFEFFSDAAGIWVGIQVVLIGVFGGLYIVPLMALIQARTFDGMRGRTMAVNSLLNALFIVVAALFSIVVLVVLEWSLSSLLMMTALGNLMILAVMMKYVPAYVLRTIMWLAAMASYRLRVEGRQHLPETGGAMILANHVSFIDWMFLGAASPRPLRFVMYKPFYDIRPIQPLLRWVGAIPITPQHEDEECYRHAMAEMAQALRNGEVLLIFPEGKLSASGELQTFREGFERVLADVPVPVIPAALHGLWGSFFSRRWGRAMRKPFKRVYSRVGVEFGEALDPKTLNAARMQALINEMLTRGKGNE